MRLLLIPCVGFEKHNGAFGGEMNHFEGDFTSEWGRIAQTKDGVSLFFPS